MDIHFAFKKTMAYSLSAGSLTGIFVVLVLISTKYFTGLTGISELGISIFSALIIALLFVPLKNRIQHIIDKLFYKVTYDYYEIIQKVSRELSTKMYLKDIEKFVADLIVDTLKLKAAHFLFAGKKYYVTVYTVRMKDIPVEESAARRMRISADSEVVRLMKSRRDIIIREEMPGFIPQERADVISEELAPFEGEVVVPMTVDGELKAFIVLSGKQSGDIFTDEDVNLLKTVSTETALSIKSAFLYAEKLRTEKLATLGRTATTLAHEIKNPLSSLKTFSQLLPERYSDEEFRTVFAEIVPAEIQRIDRLVKEMLTFAKQAPLISAIEKMEITSLLDDSLMLLSDQLRKNNIKVVKNYSGALFIKGEKDRIKQALINILSNACQAMETGGVLRVATEFNDKIDIIIEDNGPGIGERDLEKIFEPFYTTKQTGNGLGLTICKKIVEDHGGSINVSSRQGEGTSFTLSFEPVSAVDEKSRGEELPLLWNS